MHRFTRVYEGVVNQSQRRYAETDSETIREELENYMSRDLCPMSWGARVNKEARAVKIGGLGIHQVVDLSIKDAVQFFSELRVAEKHRKIAEPILKEVRARLGFLEAVGLDYRTLNRSARTLSGGGSATNSLGHADWVCPSWCALRARRTEHWFASTR